MYIYNLIRLTISHVLPHIAVPIFFFISGFLFFYKVKEFNFTVYKKKIRKRFKTLIIPYLLWNTIPILIFVCARIGDYLIKGAPLSSIPAYFESNGWLHLYWDSHVWSLDSVDWLGNKLMAMSGPCNLPLWFLRDLIVITLLTPLVYFLVKKLHKSILFILLFCYVSNIFPQIRGLHVSTVFFFTTGAFFSIYNKNILTVFNKYQSVIILPTIVFFICTIMYDAIYTLEGRFFCPFYVIGGSIIAFNVSSYWVRRKKWEIPSIFTQSSFFIYAIHTIIALKMARVITTSIFFNSVALRYLPEPMLLLMNYIVTPLVTIAICLGIYILMDRFTPRLLSLVTGNRERRRA